MAKVSWNAVLLSAVGATFSGAAAQDATCDNYRLQDFSVLRVAVVTVDRALFRDAQGTARGPYVVRGDRVVQGRAVNGRRCSYFFGASRKVSGFLNDAQATAVPAIPPARGAWIRDEDAGLVIGNGLKLTGDAVWHTPSGSVNVGSLEGTLIRRGPAWVYASVSPGDSCRLTVLNLGAALLVDDNGGCGGMNVTFQGLYRRAF
ncbi:hypothetical protein GCM10008955_30670 [Deinococcus malanensis]|uniref:Uncharacterized protein n=1 Tax=Deinococcus malanensis TaxID=1706855 RepID=A0ABQ2F043_9DEIO|nr:hypothetical protein [Deinococcus malanensis]GGK34510.1 hypothetical protein GCM10008955_30670 [Deinococcus malanensis]